MDKPDINSTEWTGYVLGLLNDDEKIAGNPTTDGLRRIFEIALDCVVTSADTTIVQAPSPENEKRATVSHSISYVIKNLPESQEDIKYRSVSGAADVYWGNCDKIYRNHPVAVAETRAEGRALRRGLRLRKVVAAEEIATNVEDDVTADSVGKITPNQISFIDVIAKRINVNILSLMEHLSMSTNSVQDLTHDNAVAIIRELSKLQQSVEDIPDNIRNYQENWK